MNPTNPALDGSQDRRVLTAWVRVANAMLSADIDRLVELRRACEIGGFPDQATRITQGIDELVDARRALEASLDELIPLPDYRGHVGPRPEANQ